MISIKIHGIGGKEFYSDEACFGLVSILHSEFTLVIPEGTDIATYNDIVDDCQNVEVVVSDDERVFSFIGLPGPCSIMGSGMILLPIIVNSKVTSNA